MTEKKHDNTGLCSECGKRFNIPASVKDKKKDTAAQVCPECMARP